MLRPFANVWFRKAAEQRLRLRWMVGGTVRGAQDMRNRSSAALHTMAGTSAYCRFAAIQRM